jgi:hypothetical protein
MRTTRHLFTSAFVSVLTVIACWAPASVSAQTVDPEFTRARQARNDAIRTGDKATFDKYTAEKFMVVGPTGAVETREQRVGRADKALPQNATLEEERITPYANGNVVILNWRQGTNRFIEVWAKENGSWKTAAVQITKIEKP